MRLEGTPNARMGEFAIDTFWYVLPTIPMFLVFGLLINRVGFVLALLCAAVLTLALFIITTRILAHFGHPLL